ncbi:MAG: HPr family phosphocarrier protein [Acholeplasmatales bacterium]|jgi:phosphocarrier protein|nr:HPr family phosphocarrier protein [Acholeplasmatales bacterium]
MEKRNFIVVSKFGLHAKPATSLVDEANKYDCDIYLSFEGISINLKSIMGLMSLGVPSGSLMSIEFAGIDEKVAVSAISDFLLKSEIAKTE